MGRTEGWLEVVVRFDVLVVEKGEERREKREERRREGSG